jgi:hypothetical protein
MNFLLKILSVAVIFGFSLDSYTMMQEMTVQERADDSAIGIVALSQMLQKINLRDYKGTGQKEDNAIKDKWYEIIGDHVEKLVLSDAVYKDLKPLFKNMKDLSDELFNAADRGNEDFKVKKTLMERLAKKQSEVKRFLLGQKAKSFFSFGKKQDEYKKMRQLLLGMIDMLNGKIDAMKKSVK